MNDSDKNIIIHKIPLFSIPTVLILYLFSFFMLSNARWRYYGGFDFELFGFIITLAYFFIGMVLAFGLMSLCMSLVKLIEYNEPKDLDQKRGGIFRNNIIRHLKIITISLICIIAFELITVDVDEEITLIIFVFLIFFTPLLVSIFNKILSKEKNIFSTRRRLSVWFSATGLGVLLGVPLANFKSAMDSSSGFINELSMLISGNVNAFVADNLIIFLIYITLLICVLKNVISDWKIIRDDIRFICLRLRACFYKKD